MSDPRRDRLEFETLVREVEPKLRRAFVALYGQEAGQDATAEALAYAWERRERVTSMANPAGFLFRVGQSRSRRRRAAFLPAGAELTSPEVEPGLPAAMERLSGRQRVAVMLCVGYGYTHAEVAAFMGISRGSVQRHVDRAMEKLRRELGVVDEP